MSSAASLTLLKGGSKKAAVADELDKTPEPAPEPTPEPETAEEDEDVVVDVDTMNTKQIDALVAEHAIAVPDTWAKMTLAKKKEWLKSQFEEVALPEGEPGGITVEQANAETAETGDGEMIEEAAEDEVVAQIEADAPEPEAATPAKGKGKTSKSKAVAAAPKSGEVTNPGEDMLADLVHEIENLKEKEAREAVKALNDETEMAMFKIGGILSVIQANGWYQPYASFREYVEKEEGMHYRKATYYVAIYNHLAESKVPWEKIKSLGWTKLKEIAEILTVDNVDDWVKIATSQTTLQLIDTVKAHKQAGAPKAIEDQASKTVTTMTFKVHEDQKLTVKAAIDKAKTEAGTTVDTAALEFICLDYMNSMTMVQRMQSMGMDAVFEAIEKAFPNVNIGVELKEGAEAAA